MDALTGSRRRKNANSSDSTQTSTSKVFQNCEPEFVPDLYKSLSGKKFRASQPENEAERLLIKSLPTDTEATILHIRNQFPKLLFHNRLPPIILYSQLSAILSNQFHIDTQLSKLARDNKILTFSTFTSSNYLIVLLDDFSGIKREGIFQRFVSQVVSASTPNVDPDLVLVGESLEKSASSQSSSSSSSKSKSKNDLVAKAMKKASDQQGQSSDLVVRRSLEHSKYFSKESLLKRWKFEENEIRQLVNGGYLGIQEGGMYCISLPGAGEFIKCFEKGKKTVMSAIKRAKFGEILQSELEQRPMKKSAPLGVLYHIYDLIGSGEIDKLETTSGPLLRIKRKTT